jgi:DNA-binding IclR family transcriptional regulator
VESILADQELYPVTNQTITDPKAFRQEMLKIRQQGYAFSFGERVDESGSISVPVFGVSRKLMCSLSVSGPSYRFQGEDLEVRLKLALETARTLSARLGSTN